MVQMEQMVRDLKAKADMYEDSHTQVQGFINQGLLVMGDNGLPVINSEAVG